MLNTNGGMAGIISLNGCVKSVSGPPAVDSSHSRTVETLQSKNVESKVIWLA